MILLFIKLIYLRHLLNLSALRNDKFYLENNKNITFRYPGKRQESVVLIGMAAGSYPSTIARTTSGELSLPAIKLRDPRDRNAIREVERTTSGRRRSSQKARDRARIRAPFGETRCPVIEVIKQAGVGGGGISFIAADNSLRYVSRAVLESHCGLWHKLREISSPSPCSRSRYLVPLFSFFFFSHSSSLMMRILFDVRSPLLIVFLKFTFRASYVQNYFHNRL